MAAWPSRLGRPAAVALLAILLFAGAAIAAGLHNPTVWIDSPLDGSVIDQEQSRVTVVGHVAGADGIDRAKLVVDGKRLAAAPLEGAHGELLTVQFDWEPTPGAHVIELWARNSDGDWDGPAVASVVVEGEVEPTPTTAPPTTATPTTASPTTAPPTTAPCEFEPPDPVSPVDGKVTPLSANTLTWSYAGCQPAAEFEVEISTTPNFTEIFFSAVVQEPSWLTPAMSCDTYWWRVRVQTFTDVVAPWSTPWSFTISHRGC